MMHFNDIISSLLLKHNCVIIPGFGGFVAKQTAAAIDFNTGLITPPKKSLLFNKQLITNDGLLVSEYAKVHQTNFQNAYADVTSITNQWNRELSQGNRITIDKVGFLFFDSEKNICFEQDKDFNLLLSSYGLGNVHFLSETDVAIMQRKVLKEELVDEKQQDNVVEDQPVFKIQEPDIETFAATENQVESPEHAIQKNEDFVIVNKERKNTNFWKYAAAACFLPILFYSMWIPLKTDVLESKMISFQDFNPFKKSTPALYKQNSTAVKENNSENEEPVSLEKQLESIEKVEDTYAYNLTDNTYILVEVDAKVEMPVAQHTTTVESNTVVNTKKQHLIIGCFSDETNAKTLVKDLDSKGFKALIVDQKNGLYRVSIGGVDTETEMSSLVKEATNAGFTGWILK